MTEPSGKHTECLTRIFKHLCRTSSILHPLFLLSGSRTVRGICCFHHPAFTPFAGSSVSLWRTSPFQGMWSGWDCLSQYPAHSSERVKLLFKQQDCSLYSTSPLPGGLLGPLCLPFPSFEFLQSYSSCSSNQQQVPFLPKLGLPDCLYWILSLEQSNQLRSQNFFGG